MKSFTRKGSSGFPMIVLCPRFMLGPTAQKWFMRFAVGLFVLSVFSSPVAVSSTKHCDFRVLNPALAILEANLGSQPLLWTNTIAVDGKLLQSGAHSRFRAWKPHY
jgi:hypothetical protein